MYIIVSEAQYLTYLRNPEQRPTRWKKVMAPSSGEHGGGSVDLFLEMKQELDALNVKIDSGVNGLWELKVQVQRVKTDYLVIAAMCVGVALGCIMSKIWK